MPVVEILPFARLTSFPSFAPRAIPAPVETPESEVQMRTPPQPKPEPEIVRLRRKATAEQATAAASAADQEATALKHRIFLAEEKERTLKIRLSRLEEQDFPKQGAEARARIKAGIENCDQGDPTRSFQYMSWLMDRAPPQVS